MFATPLLVRSCSEDHENVKSLDCIFRYMECNDCDRFG